MTTQDEGKTFIDSESEGDEKKIDYYEDDSPRPRYNFSKMSFSEIKDYIRTAKSIKGKAVEQCIVHITKEILKDKYKDVILKNGIVIDTVKKRLYFIAKAKKLKKSMGSILLYQTLHKDSMDFENFKTYVILYNYESYIEKKSLEYESIKALMKTNSIEIKLLSDLVK
jgi:hypothetical protein